MSSVAFGCLPAAAGLWLCTTPVRYVVLAAATKAPLKDVWRSPRPFFKSAAAQSSDLLGRLDAVHANAGEGLPLVFGAVLAAVVAGVDNARVDAAAVAYIVSRVAYMTVYLLSSRARPWLGPLRSMCFAAGLVPLAGLFSAAVRARR